MLEDKRSALTKNDLFYICSLSLFGNQGGKKQLYIKKIKCVEALKPADKQPYWQKLALLNKDVHVSKWTDGPNLTVMFELIWFSARAQVKTSTHKNLLACNYNISGWVQETGDMKRGKL